MNIPFLSKRIDKCIKTCDVCQKIKISNRAKNLAQLIIIKPRRANQFVTTDLASPFKVTIKGNKYYMVIVCHFTKYIQIYAVKNIQAEAVADK